MKYLALTVLGLGFLTFCSTVYAGEVSVEGFGGWGFQHAYDGEVGLREGYFFDNNVYAGVDYSHFFSGARRPSGINNVSAEGGYRIQAPLSFEVVPYIGLGSAFLEQPGAETRFLANPGVKIDYPVGPLMVGIDNQYQIVPYHNAYALAGTVGIRF
jgi:hypothetical protein